MLNLKELRNNFVKFKELLKFRNVDTNFDEILKLDEKNRELIHIKEK